MPRPIAPAPPHTNPPSTSATATQFNASIATQRVPEFVPSFTASDNSLALPQPSQRNFNPQRLPSIEGFIAGESPYQYSYSEQPQSSFEPLSLQSNAQHNEPHSTQNAPFSFLSDEENTSILRFFDHTGNQEPVHSVSRPEWPQHPLEPSLHVNTLHDEHQSAQDKPFPHLSNEDNIIISRMLNISGQKRLVHPVSGETVTLDKLDPTEPLVRGFKKGSNTFKLKDATLSVQRRNYDSAIKKGKTPAVHNKHQIAPYTPFSFLSNADNALISQILKSRGERAPVHPETGKIVTRDMLHPTQPLIRSVNGKVNKLQLSDGTLSVTKRNHDIAIAKENATVVNATMDMERVEGLLRAQGNHRPVTPDNYSPIKRDMLHPREPVVKADNGYKLQLLDGRHSILQQSIKHRIQ